MFWIALEHPVPVLPNLRYPAEDGKYEQPGLDALDNASGGAESTDKVRAAVDAAIVR